MNESTDSVAAHAAEMAALSAQYERQANAEGRIRRRLLAAFWLLLAMGVAAAIGFIIHGLRTGDWSEKGCAICVVPIVLLAASIIPWMVIYLLYKGREDIALANLKSVRTGFRGRRDLLRHIVYRWPYAIYLRGFAQETHAYMRHYSRRSYEYFKYSPHEELIASTIPRDFVFSLTNRRDANPAPMFHRVNVGTDIWFEKLSQYLRHARLIVMNIDTVTDAILQELMFVECDRAQIPLWVIIWEDAREELERTRPSFFRRPLLQVSEKRYRRSEGNGVTIVPNSVWKEVLSTRFHLPGPPVEWTRETERNARYRVGPSGDWHDLGSALDLATERADDAPWSVEWEELERAVLATPSDAPLALTLTSAQAQVLEPTPPHA